jgi:hypothetical protein
MASTPCFNEAGYSTGKSKSRRNAGLSHMAEGASQREIKCQLGYSSCAGLSRLRGRSPFGAAKAPRIHADEAVDGRVKPGHDDEETSVPTEEFVICDSPAQEWERRQSVKARRQAP